MDGSGIFQQERPPEGLLEAMLSAPDTFIGVVDPGTVKLLEVNAKGALMFGYGRPDDMRGLSVTELFAAENETAGTGSSSQAPQLDTEWSRIESVFRSRDGRRFQGDYYTGSYRESGAPRLVISIRDIDSFKRVERSLEREKQRFEALFSHATMGIIVTDERGRIAQVNQFALREFGYLREALIGKNVEDLIPKRFHAHHADYRHSYNHHPEIRPMGAGRELFGRRSDGTEFPVEISLSPYKTEEGLFIIAFVIDISVRKEKELEIIRMNEAFRQLNDELEAKVEERTRQLEGTLNELKASRDEISQSLEKEKEVNDMKSRFVAMASHEFRTPLSTILSSASLLSKYTSGEDQPKRDKHVQRIKSAVNNLTGILNEFLSVGRMEDGGLAAHPRAFDVEELLVGVCAEMRDIAKPGQQITCTHQGASTAWLDSELLRNVLINLLSNAIKFSPEERPIRVASRMEETGKLEISVTDEGMGIPAGDQQHLFERFFRADNAMNIQGTGLGLHIVAKYMELMGGELSFTSELGKGTRFILIFNRAAVAAENS
jgi:PAS domain S-box-containing protein